MCPGTAGRRGYKEASRFERVTQPHGVGGHEMVLDPSPVYCPFSPVVNGRGVGGGLELPEPLFREVIDDLEGVGRHLSRVGEDQWDQ